MRIATLEIRRLCLPLRIPVAHAAATRSVAEPLIVTLTSPNGTRGFGEVIPRPYLTGETLETCAADLEKRFWPKLREVELTPETPPWVALEGLYDEADRTGRNAAWAGLDVAAHDLWAREFRVPGARMLGTAGSGSPAGVSAVVTVGVPAWLVAKALMKLGFSDFKVKVGDRAGARRLAAVRRAVGPEVAIRLDANGAWPTLDAAREAWSQLAPSRPASLEQPFPQSEFALMAELERALGVPVMADESLCTRRDAACLAAAGGVALWNVRVAKVGGLSGARALIAEAARTKTRWQLGSLVGETNLTATATRALLALGAPAHFETSYSGTLLVDDPFRGDGARCPAAAPPLGEAFGLGVEPNERVLERRTTWVRSCR